MAGVWLRLGLGNGTMSRSIMTVERLITIRARMSRGNAVGALGATVRTATIGVPTSAIRSSSWGAIVVAPLLLGFLVVARELEVVVTQAGNRAGASVGLCGRRIGRVGCIG